MNIKPNQDRTRFNRLVLREIDALMDARAGTAEGDRLDVLVTLAEAWEQKHHAIEAPDPVRRSSLPMEQRGLSRRDLEPYIGSPRTRCGSVEPQASSDGWR